MHFDHWFLERSLYEGSPSAWDRAREKLIADGHAYESEGALWLRTTKLAGDEKDRALVKSTGEPTYLAADVAYHWDKLHRGFDKLVNVLGSDHHGYVVRLKAIVAAEGADPERLIVPLLQFVHVVEHGARASMSKRRGEFVTLAELIDEIGVDATRYFMLSRSADRDVDLDLTLASEQSRENPVYYIQYAHARMSKILRDAGEGRVAEALAGEHAGIALQPAERELVKKLLAFPAVVEEAAERRAPHLLAVYALELAQVFTAYYRDCPILKVDDEGLEVVPARDDRGDPARRCPCAGAPRRLGTRDDVVANRAVTSPAGSGLSPIEPCVSSSSPASARVAASVISGRFSYCSKIEVPTICPGRRPSDSSPLPSESVIVPAASVAKRITGAALTTAPSCRCAASSACSVARSAVMSRQIPSVPSSVLVETSRSQTQIQPSLPRIRYSMSIGGVACSTRSRSSGCGIASQCSGSSVHFCAGRPVHSSICGEMYVSRPSGSAA